MQKFKLTVRSVQDAKPGAKDVIIWDSEVKGFGLKVTPKGKRTFFLYYRTIDHTQRKPRIGDYPELKPEQARTIARDWLADVRKGNDPSGARRARRAAKGDDTIAELFESYKLHKGKEGLRSIDEVERIFRHDILPTLGKRRAEEVTSLDVSRLLDRIQTRSASVAWSVRRQFSAFYKWAIPRLPAGASNPVTNASRPPAIKARDRVLSDAELKLLWLALENEPQHWKIALRMLLLTGQRRDEVLSAGWDEFNLPDKSWTVPASRAKNGKANYVPLSPPVLKMLDELPTRSGPLFKGITATSKAAKRIRDAMPAAPEWRWHDLRRTIATGMQRLGVRLEVTEAVINHVSGSRGGIVGVYQRHDYAAEKRDALGSWALEVERIVS
ncbi:integrase arm-type DNA-binding domain-containing protein [Novosphingobium sp.]|uniref:tyrosine-type recombinase/integrase n=1 Tax=Novosphingobium sp. TaxID=1874826 RepID=UPI00286E950E|nr:integrase arm-type DNA-binding domain-containing protein [Novosphingobium sp.]